MLGLAHIEPSYMKSRPPQYPGLLMTTPLQLSFLLLGRNLISINSVYRNSRSEVFLGKGVLKICSESTREHPC